MKFDTRRGGLTILIEAAPGQGVGHLRKTIESGDKVRLFIDKKPLLAVVTDCLDGQYAGFVTSRDSHPDVSHGQTIYFEEINVDALFKQNLMA